MDKRQLEITIVCFLWGNWGGGRGVEYVNKLYFGVKRHLSISHRFVCLTDRIKGEGFAKGVELLCLDVPNWRWNLKKMFLYKPDNGLYGRVLAFDLDVVIIGNLDDIARYRGEFATCEAAYHRGRMGGSLLGFSSGFGLTRLWEPLISNPRRVENKTGGSERKYLGLQLKNKDVDFWQDLYPGQVLSYKVDCQKGVPENARVIRFHGRPRPHDVVDNHKWMRENWI